MHRLVLLTILSLVGFTSLSGCTKSESKIDPCDLLSVGDVRAVDDTVVESRWFPPEKAETKQNDLCLYYDGKRERRFMLFLWSDDPRDPRAVIESGVTVEGIRIIEISGVGEKAVAAFAEELKLLAAKSEKGMIGIRVRKAIKEVDKEFETLKGLVNWALSRLK